MLVTPKLDLTVIPKKETESSDEPSTPTNPSTKAWVVSTTEDEINSSLKDLEDNGLILLKSSKTTKESI